MIDGQVSQIVVPSERKELPQVTAGAIPIFRNVPLGGSWQAVYNFQINSDSLNIVMPGDENQSYGVFGVMHPNGDAVFGITADDDFYSLLNKNVFTSLKNPKPHPSSFKGVFADTDTGEIYTGDWQMQDLTVVHGDDGELRFGTDNFGIRPASLTGVGDTAADYGVYFIKDNELSSFGINLNADTLNFNAVDNYFASLKTPEASHVPGYKSVFTDPSTGRIYSQDAASGGLPEVSTGQMYMFDGTDTVAAEGILFKNLSIDGGGYNSVLGVPGSYLHIMPMSQGEYNGITTENSGIETIGTHYCFDNQREGFIVTTNAYLVGFNRDNFANHTFAVYNTYGEYSVGHTVRTGHYIKSLAEKNYFGALQTPKEHPNNHLPLSVNTDTGEIYSQSLDYNGLTGKPDMSGYMLKSAWGIPCGGYCMTGAYSAGDDRIVLPFGSPVNFDEQDFTLELFFRLKESAVANVFLLGSYHETALYGYELSVDTATGKLAFGWGDGSTRTSQSGGISLEIDTLYHLITAYDKTEGKIRHYINGMPDEIVKDTQLLAAHPAQSFALGAYNSAGQGSPKDIYLFRAYNRALTADEASLLYNGGRPDLAGLPYSFAVTAGLYNPTGNCTNTGFTTFTDVTPSGFTATSDGGGVYLASTNDEIKFRKGKTYKVEFNCLINSGANLSLSYPESNTGGGNGSVTSSGYNYADIGTGYHSYTFKAAFDITGVITFRSNSVVTDFTISDIRVTEIGCIAAYLPQYAGNQAWKDISGNEAHGVVYGAKPIQDNEFTVASLKSITGDSSIAGAIPVGYECVRIKLKNTTGNSVTVKLGTSPAGTEISGGTTVGANSTAYVNVNIQFIALTGIFISSTAWSGAAIDVTVINRKCE